jgi:acetyl esterase/lipase
MAIDPVMQQVLDAVPLEGIAEVGYQRLREVVRERIAMLPVTVRLPKVENRTIADRVPARIYSPVAEPKGLPIVVFYHGGGFVIGDLDTHDGVCRSIAEQAGALVVAVDYRLAPEHPFPAAVDDAWAALRWVAEHAEQLGGDPARLAVAGDSAGGNLSAVVAQLARDAGGPSVKFQLLWYPATTLDDTLPSVAENAHAPMLTKADIDVFLELYVGERPERPATLAPARAKDLSGLPPAFIATAEFDPIRDDGVRYAELLRAAGVPVEHHHAETLIHGYLTFAVLVPAAAEAFNASLAALKAAL